MQSEQIQSSLLTRFVDTFTESCRPGFMAMSGGEALLRPALVRSLALRARQSGTRSSVLSGMFFAKHGNIPRPVKEAILAVDHFSVSMDVFHEREVPRAQVFKVLRTLLDEGKHLSMHVAGEHADDPYLDDIVADVQKHFGQRIPMLVNTLSPFGRAKTFFVRSLAKQQDEPGPVEASPCTMAAWPVVGFDGVVAACGNDNLIGCVPEHLKLGDIRTDTWADIEKRCRTNPMQQALRTFGPEYLQSRAGLGAQPCTGYCDTCIHMNSEPRVRHLVESIMQKPGADLLATSVLKMQVDMGAVGFARRYSHPRFADLVLLGS